MPAEGHSCNVCMYGPSLHLQDAMGTRRDCEKAFNQALYAGRDIVVDRCNVDSAQRNTWLFYAKSYGAKCIGVQLKLPLAVCYQRALARKEHPTLGVNDPIAGVIQR